MQYTAYYDLSCVTSCSPKRQPKRSYGWDTAAAQDGGARRRARGAVLPVVPPRVPKDHGVARGAAGAGRRVAGGALDLRANPAPSRWHAGPMLWRCSQRHEERKRTALVTVCPPFALSCGFLCLLYQMSSVPAPSRGPVSHTQAIEGQQLGPERGEAMRT